MSNYVNRSVILSKRPCGEIQDGDLTLMSNTVPAIKDGEMLIRTLWLSLDPYMRPRMNDIKGYMDPLAIGDVIVGESVGRVIESRTDRFEVGDVVTCFTGWQEYYIADENQGNIHKVIPNGVPVQAFLGVVGMPGRTGYCGLTYLGRPKAGETVVVAAATGPVGSVVGQTAKQLGCRAVGIAGGPEKCRYLVEELGFDAAVDYKSGDFQARLRAACPNGIDVYFENVGGEVTRAAAQLLNPGSRAPICGYISAYNATDITAVETPFDIFGALDDPPEHRFFLVTEWQDQHQEITDLLADRVRKGEINYRESVAEGLENAVDAFKGMLKGKNFGKQLVHIAD
jgi:NADPH-dependent curcumin reductase CurA